MRPMTRFVPALGVLVLVLAEGTSKMDHVVIPPEPAAMAAATAPMMVLPSDESADLTIMMWSTAGFPVMVNGASSLITPEHQELRDLMMRFPDTASIDRLHSLGVRSVVVLRDRVVGGLEAQQPLRPLVLEHRGQQERDGGHNGWPATAADTSRPGASMHHATSARPGF